MQSPGVLLYPQIAPGLSAFYPGIMTKVLVTLAAVAAIAVGAAPVASANGGFTICGTGPWGYVTACWQGPGWVDGNPWNNGWHGHGHGHGWDD